MKKKELKAGGRHTEEEEGKASKQFEMPFLNFMTALLKALLGGGRIEALMKFIDVRHHFRFRSVY